MKKKKNNISLVVVLDNIRSTYNVGAIFRTSDAACVAKIYLCGITPTPPNHKIAKVALGAEKFLTWEKRKNTWFVLKQLKSEGYFIIGLEQGKKAKNLFQLKKIPASKIALVLGSETKGLSSKILKRVDWQVEIPMFGKKESLNVAVAFGIAVYQIRNILYN